jgi:predicted DNA-binding transcriptional regulator YafY
VAQATLQRKKLWIEYHSRGKDERTERTVSPQRIVHYREAWYLDAWDEGKDALRSFSIERIRRATVLEKQALDVAESDLDEHYSTAYGIFGGKADKIAVLRFTPERARWVADEQWHPQQEGTWLPDGSYELRIPYRESRELVMDVMRNGAGVEVLTPVSLRQEVAVQLQIALKPYA